MILGAGIALNFCKKPGVILHHLPYFESRFRHAALETLMQMVQGPFAKIQLTIQMYLNMTMLQV